MSDLVERLRFDVGSRPGGICEEAAREIERLRAEFSSRQGYAAMLEADVVRLRNEVERLTEAADGELLRDRDAMGAERDTFREERNILRGALTEIAHYPRMAPMFVLLEDMKDIARMGLADAALAAKAPAR